MAAIRRQPPQPLTFWHWSGVTPYTSSCELAGSCVFDKQSPGIFCCNLNSSLRQVLLLTYDRCFAEFLHEESPVRLGLLALPTCVGLWYGSDAFQDPLLNNHFYCDCQISAANISGLVAVYCHIRLPRPSMFSYEIWQYRYERLLSRGSLFRSFSRETARQSWFRRSETFPAALECSGSDLPKPVP